MNTRQPLYLAIALLLVLRVGQAPAMDHDDHAAMDHDDHAAMDHDDHAAMDHDDHAAMDHDDHAAMDHDDHAGMMHGEGMKHDTEHEMHDGRGVVQSVNVEHGMVSITHEPMPSLGWPRMRMNFETTEGLDLSGIEAGQAVSFTLHVDPNGDYRLCEIAPAP